MQAKIYAYKEGRMRACIRPFVCFHVMNPGLSLGERPASFQKTLIIPQR